MSLQRCTLSWQAFTTCASHAMSTEKQEVGSIALLQLRRDSSAVDFIYIKTVMGLLLGRWHDGTGRDGTSCPVVTVDHAMILTRTDKREDRVEVGYKQLAEAADIAERMSSQLGQDTRVVGWYHSHPHITVLPSHVDVRTQGQYQSMDRRFIGLIFSVFSEDKHSKVGTIEVTAFQARDTSEPTDVDAAAGAGAGRGNRGGGGGGWERTEVALSLHGPGSGSSTTPLSDALERVVRLQDTLFGEERAGYLAALRQNDAMVGEEEPFDAESPQDAGTRRRGEGIDLLSKLFCSAVYSKSLAALSGDSAVPLAQTLRSQLNILQNRAAALEQRQLELRASLSPGELEEALASASAKLRAPCSAGIGAFQAKHEGELDIPRADALRFARQGGPLRRQRILMSANTAVNVRVFREYAKRATSSAAIADRVETSDSREAGGALWVAEIAGKRKTLLGLRAAAPLADGGSSSKQQERGLVIETREGGEEVLLCDDQDSFRLWLGVAAAVFPSGAFAATAASGSGHVE